MGTAVKYLLLNSSDAFGVPGFIVRHGPYDIATRVVVADFSGSGPPAEVCIVVLGTSMAALGLMSDASKKTTEKDDWS